jgi:hypothetical protein
MQSLLLLLPYLRFAKSVCYGMGGIWHTVFCMYTILYCTVIVMALRSIASLRRQCNVMSQAPEQGDNI